MDIASLPRLDKAILKTVAYVEIYEYLVPASEIHRCLFGGKSTEAEFDKALYNLSQNSNFLECREWYYSLVRRLRIYETRKQCKEIAKFI